VGGPLWPLLAAAPGAPVPQQERPAAQVVKGAVFSFNQAQRARLLDSLSGQGSLTPSCLPPSLAA
jgi:16S rRNA G966 N2-methylase RsmD